MMRTPEPELMDALEQTRAYSEADFAEAHDAFVAYFRQRFGTGLKGRVLDLGCGPADVTVRFAHAYPDIKVVGVDGAEAMLALGRERLAREGLSLRISLRRVHLPASLDDGYDAVISNSLLHHLAEPQVLWETVKKTVRPGAPVFVMDLMRPHSVEEAERLTERYAADAPPILRKDFFASLLAAYQPDEVEQQLHTAGLERLHVEAVSDRHLAIWGSI